MSSSTKTDNRKNDFLILGKSPTQGAELGTEKMYTVNFSGKDKKFCLCLHYNGTNNYFFVNGKEIHKFKGKILKLQQLYYAQETF